MTEHWIWIILFWWARDNLLNRKLSNRFNNFALHFKNAFAYNENAHTMNWNETFLCRVLQISLFIIRIKNKSCNAVQFSKEYLLSQAQHLFRGYQRWPVCWRTPKTFVNNKHVCIIYKAMNALFCFFPLPRCFGSLTRKYVQLYLVCDTVHELIQPRMTHYVGGVLYLVFTVFDCLSKNIRNICSFRCMILHI